MSFSPTRDLVLLTYRGFVFHAGSCVALPNQSNSGVGSDFRFYADNTTIDSWNVDAAGRWVESRGRVNESHFAIENGDIPQLIIAVSQKFVDLGKRCIMAVSILAHGPFVISIASRLLTGHPIRTCGRTHWLEHNVSKETIREEGNRQNHVSEHRTSA
ncbi:hypothetical protein [Pararhizobium antarcticum]|uniref:hypothetical protein n=1 Tax=Pararhizobium antarcticum TaxID=1798805 RepID=UPI001114A9E3|nr:hypothetical protein [Pararhizobium antarcticum]